MTYLPPANGGRINASIGGNTAGAGALISSGTMVLAGGNNITLSQAGNTLTISGAAGGGGAGSNTLGMSNLGNTSGTTGVVAGSNLQFAFAGGNNVTLSQSLNASSGTVTISAANQSIQTQNMASINGSTGNISFSNANNVSFGGNASAITASASFSQSVQTQGVQTAVIAGNTAGATASISSGAMTLAGGNNITLSQAGNAITISGGAGGGGGIGAISIDAMTSYNSGTVNFVDQGALTISSDTGQKINFSVPNTSSLVGAGGITISTAGNTISISGDAGGGGTTLSRWEYPTNAFGPLNTTPQSSLSIQHVYNPFNVVGASAKIGGMLTLATFTSATTASVNYSLWMGIYTLSGSTLSLASSGSANNGFSWLNTANSTQYTSLYPGMRQLTVPMNVSITPGEYWMAAVLVTATTYTSTANNFTIYGNSVLPTAAGSAVLTPLGSSTSAANRDVILFQGVYSTTATSGPASITGGHINNTSASIVQRAGFYHAIYNATY